MANNIEITLLTSAEYEKHQNIIPLIDSGWWWLKDASSMHYGPVYCINGHGTRVDYNYYYSGYVRPALRIKLANAKALNLVTTSE